MTVRLLLGDCVDVLRTLGPESIDACVTDPPYGLSFMGKRWDANVPSVEVWREVLRVLKPGGHVLSFGGTRTYHRMVCAIEDAGFEIRDQLAWIFGSGFPKSLDVSKAIDKAGGSSPVLQAALLRARREAAGLSRDEVAKSVGCTISSVRDWEEGRARAAAAAVEFIVPSDTYRAKLADLLGYSCDERAILGNSAVDRRGDGTVFGVGHSGTLRAGGATDAARQWEGWGTALKPAHEPIVLARKPLSGTVAANVQAHGTGAINVAGCRIDGESGSDLGRWPANVLHDGSDEVLEAFPEASGQMADITGDEPTAMGFSGTVYGAPAPRARARARVEGDLSAARFFYCAKASREDREDGLAHLTKRPLLWSFGDKNPGSFQAEGTDRSARNNHPTVKPTELMRYLCRLITPPGGTVLDPFMGSGSTGRGAFLEDFSFIGIERDAQWLPIAEARIRAISPLFFEVMHE